MNMITVNKWSKSEIEFLVKNYDKMPLKELCILMGRKNNSIAGKVKLLRSLGKMPFAFQRRPQILEKIAPETIRFIRKNFPLYGSLYCLERLPELSQGQLNNINATLGIKKKPIPNKRIKRVFNVELFKKLDYVSVYLLGLIWGDGYLDKKQRKIGIDSEYNDLTGVLPYFLRYGSVYFKERYRPNRKKQLTISVSNKEFYDFLVELGYLNKKRGSANEVLKHIPDDLKKYWYLGFFDADGHITFKEDQKGNAESSHFSLTSKYEQEWDFIHDLFKSLEIVSYTVYRHEAKKINHKFSAIRIAERREIYKFLNFIYDDYKNIGFTRKYIKYVELGNHLEYQAKNKYYFV